MQQPYHINIVFKKRLELLLPVYSPFSDRVGLPLSHNIPSPFLPVTDVFSVDL